MKTMKNNVVFFSIVLLLWTNVESSPRYPTPKPPNCPNNTVECAPQFRGNFTSDTIFSELRENENQEFICPEAYGNPTPNVTWSRNDIRLNESKFRLTIYGLKFDQDQGNYTCVVCNGLGCIKHTFRVSIKREGLKIVDGPKNATKKIGEKYELKCQHNAPLDKPNAVKIEWYYGTSDPVDPDKGPIGDQSETLQDNETKRGILISTTEVEIKNENQTGWYTCGVVTREKAVYKSAFLKVEPEDVGYPSFLQYFFGVTSALLLAIVVLISYHKFRKRYSHIVEVIVTITDLSSKADELKSIIKVTLERLPPPWWFIGGKYSPDRPEYKFQKDKKWDFPRKRLRLLSRENLLGAGNSGKVYKAEARLRGSKTWTPVAVKVLKMEKNKRNDEAVKNFVLETEIMKAIGKHKNFVSLLGVCVHKGKMMVIMEYAARGSLLSLLRNRSHVVGNRGGYAILGNNLSELKLLGYAHQIAEAMEFLASRRCIHRDLAARNILVTENDEIKVADFGLARNVHEDDYIYRSTTDHKMPYKWMAPEVLMYRNKYYTSKADVWSFGIVLYEMFSGGEELYPGQGRDEVLQTIRRGERLSRPQLCSMEIYRLMEDCWRNATEERPTFTVIKERLTKLINDMKQAAAN